MLVKNPYASSVDISSLLATGTGIYSNKFWVWDPAVSGNYGVGAYVSYDNGLMVPVTTNYPAPTTIIQGGQAFLIQANSTTASITYQQNYKTASEKDIFGLMASQPLPSAIYTNLMVPSGDTLVLADGVGAGLDDRFSNAVDKDDASKRWNFEENIALVRNQNTLAIECRQLPALTDTLFYRLYLKQEPYVLKIFTQNFKNVALRAWVVDKYLNTKTEINLHDTTLYSFTPNRDTNSYRNRFMLVYNRQFTATPVPITKAVNQNNPNETGSANSLAATALRQVTIYPNPVSTQKAMLRFNGMNKGNYEITVYSPKGEKLASHKINHDGSNNIYPLSLDASWANGVYSISILSSDNLTNITHLKLIIAK